MQVYSNIPGNTTVSNMATIRLLNSAKSPHVGKDAEHSAADFL